VRDDSVLYPGALPVPDKEELLRRHGPLRRAAGSVPADDWTDQASVPSFVLERMVVVGRDPCD